MPIDIARNIPSVARDFKLNYSTHEKGVFWNKISYI